VAHPAVRSVSAEERGVELASMAMNGGNPSHSAGPLRRPAGRVTAWLRRVPVSDPVDRRNAPMLQVVLLLLGIPTPLIWLYRVLFVAQPWRPGELQSMAMAMATSAVALFSVWLIRRGRFQWAIRQVLALIAVSTIYAYSIQGADRQSFEEPILVLWIVLAGLMIGRRALWLMFGAIAVAFAAGIAHAFTHVAADGTPPSTEAMVIATKAIIFLMIALAIDRSVLALRDALTEVSLHGDELASTNERLQKEMAERRQTEDKLIHARKVEAIGRLAVGVAHDFRHLLTLIAGYAAKGLRAQDGFERLGAFEDIEATTKRATAVTNRLLDFSRDEPARIERLDPVAALRDMQPMLQQLLGPTIKLKMLLPDHSADVLFDRTQLDLVVLNVAANAKAAMPDGGRLQLVARIVDEGRCVEIDLSDTGHGMTDEVVARIFDPFFTTRPAGEGLGLGLPLVQSLIETHGGRIEVLSTVGQGTSFRLKLPVVGADAGG